MKKLILSITAVMISTFMYAQVQFGAKAGINIATATGTGTDNIAGKSSLLSFHFGGLASIPVSDAFSVQPELTYSGQGVKGSESGETYTYKLNYLNIPVLAKYTIASGFAVEAGPQLGFLLGGKFKYNGTTTTLQNTSSVDFSIDLGLSYLIPSSNFGIDARYNIGLANVNNGVDASENELKNSVIQIGLFYMINTNSKSSK